MTLEEIETFLAVVEHHTLSAAARFLFITQGTASSRIQALEKELNGPLFVREKGKKAIELTTFGNAFIPIAQQWLTLWKETQALHQSTLQQHLTIGSVDLVNNYTFLPLYKRHLLKKPHFHLSIGTFHSNEIHEMLLKQRIDIGYVFSQVHYGDIISEPVYREKMYLLCHKYSPYYDGISVDQLPPKQEIYLRWASDYEIWHDTYWPGRQALVDVNTGSMLAGYLDQPGRWGIAPMSLVAMLENLYSLTHYTLKNPPPHRICYQLTLHHPRNTLKTTLEEFCQEVREFINENITICTFEPWMKVTGE